MYVVQFGYVVVDGWWWVGFVGYFQCFVDFIGVEFVCG